MRKRALTIYAENKENFLEVNFIILFEYIQQLNNLEATEKIKGKTIQPKSKSKSKLTEIIEDGSNLKITEEYKNCSEYLAFSEENFDFLSHGENFKVKFKFLIFSCDSKS